MKTIEFKNWKKGDIIMYHKHQEFKAAPIYTFLNHYEQTVFIDIIKDEAKRYKDKIDWDTVPLNFIGMYVSAQIDFVTLFQIIEDGTVNSMEIWEI